MSETVTNDTMVTPTKTFKRLLANFRSYWGLLAFGVLGNLIYAVIDGIMYKYLQPLIDKGFVERDAAFLKWVPVFIIAIFLIRGTASFISTYFMGRIGRSVVMEYRNKMLRKFMHLPMKFFDSSSYGELVSKINYDAEQVAEAVTDAVNISMRGFLTAISLLVVMISINWQVTVMLVFTAPILFGFIKFMSKYMRRYSTRIQNSMGHITHTAEEIVGGQRVIRTFGGLDVELSRIANVTKNNYTQEMKMIAVKAFSIPMMQFIGAAAMALLVYFVMFRDNNMTPGDFTAMFAAMLGLLRPIKQIAIMNSTVQRGIAAAQSIFTLLDAPQEDDTGRKVLSKINGEIAFKQVNFSYASEQQILHNIDFMINPGETVALVGKSGSGKSTISSLLPRFYEITTGEITIDGINITELKLDNLRQQLAVVTQNVILFNDTIANNIAYGCNQTASMDEIINAAKMANAMEFISRLPKGMNTLIGENGIRLSGGQRQRLAIARAILKNSPILILDEATSSLDNESEKLIQVALDNLMRDRTTLVIAHRLSTIEHADKILVLEHGKIVETGTHQELFAKKGYYYSLQQAHVV